MNKTSNNNELRWKTYTHLTHPYGDLLWHLFWGIIIGISIISAIFNSSFWLLIVSLIALVFFFHPTFYQPKLLDIKLNQEGVYVNKKFYSWKKFYAFEIFENDFRKFIFFFPKNLSFGLHIPIEEFFVSEREIKNFLKNFLEEEKNKIPILDKIYRAIFL